MGHMTLPDHAYLGKYFIPVLTLDMAYLCAKSEDSIFRNSRDMKEDP